MTLGGINLVYLLGLLAVFGVAEVLSWKRGKDKINTVSQLIIENQKKSRLFAWVIFLLLLDLAALLIAHFETLRFL